MEDLIHLDDINTLPPLKAICVVGINWFSIHLFHPFLSARIHSMTATLELTVKDTELFNTLNHAVPKIRGAIALSKKRGNWDEAEEVEQT
jgi:hypothetical protein